MQPSLTCTRTGVTGCAHVVKSMNCVRFACLLAVLCCLKSVTPLHAQWVTQTNSLRAGWNAVFLHVDPWHTNLIALTPPNGPIEEIWLWHPNLPTGQFVESPQQPGDLGSQWSKWTRLPDPGSTLQTIRGNSALLVRMNNSAAPFEWRVKGKPVTPTYRWTLTGLNFIGFPTPASAPPTWESFLVHAPELQNNAEIFRYQGGELGPTNPIPVVAFRTTPVRRDQAYWLRAGESYNQYFGPFQISGNSDSGISFADSLGQSRLRLKNVTETPLTVTLRLLPSEAPPAGQSAIQGTPPLLIRGPINTTNLTFTYSNLNSSPYSWTLAPKGQPGSEVEVIVGLNRTQMGSAPGALYAGILRFTDSLNLSTVDISVSGTIASRAGLWVGNAAAEYVSQYLKPYARATNQADFQGLLNRLGLGQGVNGYRYEWDTNTSRVLVFGGPQNRRGSYLLDGPIKLDSGGVARPFPMRLIVHNNGSSSVLLQRAYFGAGNNSNLVVATREEGLLPAQLAQARRVSAVHLPFSEDNPQWSFAGVMQEGGSITARIQLGYNDHASNPFLHAFHPDHDNLDAQFEAPLTQGVESYAVDRLISLQFTPPENNFDSLTRASTSLSGNYLETITVIARPGNPGPGDTKQFNVLGTFTLNRITDIATLTTQ